MQQRGSRQSRETEVQDVRELLLSLGFSTTDANDVVSTMDKEGCTLEDLLDPDIVDENDLESYFPKKIQRKKFIKYRNGERSPEKPLHQYRKRLSAESAGSKDGGSFSVQLF